MKFATNCAVAICVTVAVLAVVVAPMAACGCTGRDCPAGLPILERSSSGASEYVASGSVVSIAEKRTVPNGADAARPDSEEYVYSASMERGANPQWNVPLCRADFPLTVTVDWVDGEEVFISIAHRTVPLREGSYMTLEGGRATTFVLSSLGASGEDVATTQVFRTMVLSALDGHTVRMEPKVLSGWAIGAEGSEKHGYLWGMQRTGVSALPTNDGTNRLSRFEDEHTISWTVSLESKGGSAPHVSAVHEFADGSVAVLGLFSNPMRVAGVELSPGKTLGPNSSVFALRLSQDGRVMWARTVGALGIYAETDLVSSVTLQGELVIFSELSGQQRVELAGGQTAGIGARFGMGSVAICMDDSGKVRWAKELTHCFTVPESVRLLPDDELVFIGALPCKGDWNPIALRYAPQVGAREVHDSETE